MLTSANIALTGDYTTFTADWNLTGMDLVDVGPGDEIRFTFMPSDWADFDHGNWAGDNWIWAYEKSGSPVNITLQEKNYGVGYVWNHNADYQSGTLVDTTAGNPFKDSQGNPVWRNESLQITGGLSDPTPWFKGDGLLMNWVEGWQGSNNWARGLYGNSGYGRSPFIPKVGGVSRLEWNTYHNSGSFTPSVTWVSPVGGKVSVSGTLQFASSNYVLGQYREWNMVNWTQLGYIDVNGVGGPAIVAKKSAADGTWTVLASTNIGLTADDTNVDWDLTGLDNIDVRPGDQIRFTFMPSDWAAFNLGNWAGDNWMWAHEKSGAPVNIVLKEFIPQSPRAYNAGYIWNRPTDYDAGTVADTTTGNPNTDAAGNPVWRNESLQITGGLSDPTPWYAGTGYLMNWNLNYQGGSYWARGVAGPTQSPLIGKDYMYWQTYHDSASYTSSSTWISPVSGNISISGAFEFSSYNYVLGQYREWDMVNWAQLGYIDVDGVGGPAVIAKKSAADGTWTVLSSTNVALTYDGTYVEWNLTGLDSIAVSPGDQIRFTFIPSDWAAFDLGNWAGDNWMWSREKAGAPVNIKLNSVASAGASTINYSDDITIDGNLSDWANATWKPFDKVYDGAPADIADGSAWAAKWGAGGTRVFAAVKVKDTAHFLTNSYTDWNARDAVELYLNTTGTEVGPYGANNYGQFQEQAQEWALGIMNSDHSSVWATCGYGPAFGDYTPSTSNLVAKGSVSGDWLYYEAAITPYEYFGGRRGNPSVVSLLYANDLIRADAIAVGRNSTAYTGMKTSGHGSSADSWSSNYMYLAQHELTRSGVKGTITLQGFFASTLGVGAKVVITSPTGASETHELVLDQFGTYSFETALTGSCTAVASAPGYASQSKPVVVTSGQGAASFILAKQTAVAASIGEAKKKAVGSGVILTGSITAVFANSIYIEANDRSSGIRVDKASHGFTNSDVGKIVEVTGSVDKDSATQETFIYSDVISTLAGTNVLQPLGLTNKATGGGAFGAPPAGQVGVAGGTGLNNIGLLVSTTGWVTEPTSDGFTLTDGSGVALKVTITGGGGAYAGSYVSVTGISSIASGGVRVIKARTADDVVAATE